MSDDETPIMPSEVSTHVGAFDRFADYASRFASKAWFFVGCVLLIVLWAPSILVVHTVDTWQLIVNTVTTIVTFLLVALLQNSQTRSDLAVQQKLNAIADALSDYLAAQQGHEEDAAELRKAVGLEQHESTEDNENDDASKKDGSKTDGARQKADAPQR